jgi:hypothetical protein
MNEASFLLSLAVNLIYTTYGTSIQLNGIYLISPLNNDIDLNFYG